LIGNKYLACCGATIGVLVALVFGPAAIAAGSAAPTSVTVRVEGLNKELLAPKTVTTKTGSITKDGIPKGTCPASSATGALDVATHHDWGGTYDSKYGLELTSILGEAHPFSSKDYWEIFVNNVPAATGACALTLHHGEQLLFAAVSDSGPAEYPLALIVPSHAAVGHAFKGEVVYYDPKGKRKPLAGATVSVGGHSSKTGSSGKISLNPGHAGTFTFTATHKGYIRSAPVKVKITS
jgi:hypothetical protein